MFRYLRNVWLAALLSRGTCHVVTVMVMVTWSDYGHDDHHNKIEHWISVLTPIKFVYVESKS